MHYFDAFIIHSSNSLAQWVFVSMAICSDQELRQDSTVKAVLSDCG